MAWGQKPGVWNDFIAMETETYEIDHRAVVSKFRCWNVWDKYCAVYISVMVVEIDGLAQCSYISAMSISGSQICGDIWGVGLA